MAVSRQPEMTQFFQEITGYNDDDGSLRITFRAFGNTSAEKSVTIPLNPDTSKLEPYEVNLHSSPASGYKMPAHYNAWFSECFGYEVMLVYLGANTRAVLFEDMQPIEPDPLTRFLRDKLPFTKGYVERLMGLRQTSQWRIGFADCAPYLICSQTSLEDVSSRLPEGEEMDITKFRPNIVIAGAFEAYQEDYWGKLKINNRTEIVMAHNCVRCKSINIDYETGKPGVGAKGEVLKRLQKDRRIDIGAKWSPVFGRYSFWGVGEKSEVVRVGDRVNVSKVNDGLTIWSKFCFQVCVIGLLTRACRLAGVGLTGYREIEDRGACSSTNLHSFSENLEARHAAVGDNDQFGMCVSPSLDLLQLILVHVHLVRPTLLWLQYLHPLLVVVRRFLLECASKHLDLLREVATEMCSVDDNVVNLSFRAQPNNGPINVLATRALCLPAIAHVLAAAG
jgi:uncharacterized protein YcbX